MLLLFIGVSADVSGGGGGFRLMTWNLLNWPNTLSIATDTTQRCPYFRTVVQHALPSIVVTQENQSTSGTTIFLNQVMNANGNYYRQGAFISGPDSNNGIFFLDSLFRFVSNRPIETTLRDISEFTLVYRPTGDTIRIYSVHLKASTGSSNEQQRASEVDSLRKVTNSLAPGTDFIVCGDFNIYGDYESAYQKLIRNDPWNDGHFIDPYSMTGVWNNASYSFYHTQSTRFSQVGGGASGGMNDRFDMILYSSAASQSGGLMYVPGTCLAVGNDGQHYRQSINAGTNNAVSAQVADALYGASDHLPVIADFEIGTAAGMTEPVAVRQLVLFPVPASGSVNAFISLSVAAEFTWEVRSTDGRTMARSGESQLLLSGDQRISLELPEALSSGVYFTLMKFDNELIVKRLYIYK